MKPTLMKWLVALLVISCWAITFVVVPPFHTPDEPSHYENILRLARGYYPYQIIDKTKKNVLYVSPLEKLYTLKSFSPSIVDRSSLWNTYSYSGAEEKQISKENFQAYHPFLYYILLVPSQWVGSLVHANIIDRYYISRLFNSLFYFASLFIFFQILKLVVSDKKMQWAVFLFFALNPLVLKSYIGINPDNGVAFFSLLFLYFLLRTKKITLLSAGLLSFIAGCATLSKETGIATVFAIAYIILSSPNKLVHKIRLSCVSALVFLVTVSPWLILSYFRYHSFGSSAVLVAWGGPLKPKPFFLAFILGIAGLRHTIMHYAGFFGPRNNIYPPKYFFLSYTGAFIVLWGVGVWKTYFKKTGKIEKTYNIKLFTYMISFLIFYCMLGFYFNFSGALWDIQGRYALALFPVLCYFVVQSIPFTFAFVVFSLLHFSYSVLYFYTPIVCRPLEITSCLNDLHPWFSGIFIAASVVFLLSVVAFVYSFIVNKKK